MSKEGSTQAPTRHPLKFRDPDFINPEKIDQEMRRVFDTVSYTHLTLPTTPYV